MLLNGQVTVFTDHHVAVAVVDGLTNRHEDTAGQVHLTVLSRDALAAIEVRPIQDAVRNTVMAWRADRSGLEDMGWPARAAVSLIYPSLTRAVVLPSRPSKEDFEAFLPALIDDQGVRP